MRTGALIAGLMVLLWPVGPARTDEVFQTPEDFLAETFDGDVPEPMKLWITKPLKADIARILGHGMGVLRVRYWAREGRTAWILEEIGKVKPITTGLVVDRGRLEQVKVLIFRESRGWEVRYPFFTEQFKGAELIADLELDRRIEGISGATLSVNALRRLAALALYLHAQANARGEG
jgi:hypothetical protein